MGTQWQVPRATLSPGFLPLPRLRVEGGPQARMARARSGDWADSAGRAVVFNFFCFFFSQHFVSLITYTMVTSHIHNKSYS